MNIGQTNLQSLPKVELHRHLEGSLRFSTLLELAPQVGIAVPTSLAEQKEKLLVASPMKDLATVLQKFTTLQAVLHSEEILARITFEAIEDAANEGIKILELRYAPTFIQDKQSHLSFEKSFRAVCRGVEMAQKIPIAVGLIATVQRILPVSVGQQVLDFVLNNRDSFVGIDLADSEEGFEAKRFAELFQRAHKENLPITIHAGEAKIPQSAQNVIDAIEILGARRIGHGVQIAYDEKALSYVRSHKVPLELCPISNWLTQAVPTLGAHPIKKLMNDGVLVTVNSDDPGVFGTSLTADYEVLAKQHQFTIADFDKCNDVAASASFIPLAKKQKFWSRNIQA